MMLGMIKKLLVLAIGLGVVALVAGYVLGRDSAAPVWQTGKANVSVEGRLVSIKADDWTYGFARSVHWIDEKGASHENGWPTCLTGNTTEIEFLSLPREIEGIGKPVVAVDCRGSN